MIVLKVVLQIAIGAAALLTVYLDYKWYDKRKKEFKKGRNWLISIMLVILAVSIISTVHDESEQTKEKEKLTTDLGSMRDSLLSIRKIGIDLNNQIEPILNLARKKYPGIPIEEAILKIQHDLDSLERKTSFLENKEESRNQSEKELAILKKTKPSVHFGLGIIDKNLRLYIDFENKVPIEFRPYLSDIFDKQGKSYKKAGNRVYEFQKVYPDKNGEKKLYFDFFDLSNYDLPQNTTFLFKAFVHYRSIYFGIENPNLKEENIEINYVYNPIDKTMTPWKRE